MKQVMPLLLLLVCFSGNCQMDLRRISESDLPTDIEYLGKFKMALQWTDNTGDNIMVVAGEQATSPVTYHYLITGDRSYLTWKVLEPLRPCGWQSENHAGIWSVITDLDHDGKAEVWIVNKSQCIGEMNNGRLKIVVIEDGIKYVMESSINDGNTAAPPVNNVFGVKATYFKDYAVRLWNKFSLNAD